VRSSLLAASLCATLLLSTSFTGDDTGPTVGPVEVSGERRPAPAAAPATPAHEAVPEESVAIVSAADGLDAGLVAAVLELDGVLVASRLRSATVGLHASTAGDGSPRDTPPPGMRIPANVTAIDPVAYPEVLGQDVGSWDAELLRALLPGEVLLSRSSARLRELGPGARVDLGQASGLAVIGIVDDMAARGSEFIAHVADADRIGLGARESLLVRSLADVAPLLDVVVARTVGADEDGVRVRHSGSRVQLVLSALEVKQRFGEFAFRLIPNQREVDIERQFVDRWITTERMPVIGDVRCHRLIMDDLRAAIEESVEAGYADWFSSRSYGGCFHPRRIATGRENLSRHAWGIAIDLNVDFSQPGAGPIPTDEFIAIWGRHGFRWGGDFTTPDNHHFEWVGDAASTRPARAQSAVQPAGASSRSSTDRMTPTSASRSAGVGSRSVRISPSA
jgi:hypothetical protein